MKAYLSFFKLRFAVQLQYRAAAVASLTTNFFFGMVRVMVFQAFYASSTLAQPLTLQQTVTYTWMAQATFRLQPFNLDKESIEMIRTGNIAYELCRPLHLYFVWYFRLMSFRLVPALLAGTPIIVVAYLLPGDYGMMLPASPAAAVAWIISTFFALLLSCAISNLVSVSTLWTISAVGIQSMFLVITGVLSGLYIPLSFFPDGMQTVLRILPFGGLLDIPLRFYLGLVPASDIFSLGLLQLFWILAFIFTGVALLNQGIKRVVVQGG